MVSVEKASPGGGEKCAALFRVMHGPHLPGNLVGSQEIIGIEPLNVITVAQGQGSVSGRGGALIVLGDDTDAVALELPRDRQRSIGGPIIDDDDLRAWPRLGQRRAECFGEPLLRVVRRDEDRHQSCHAGRLASISTYTARLISP